ncbi:MAG: hypothetical protein H0W40_15380 [Methylibium sp.]|uniref:hypothetical protein n=1 Tax=Methylibium sp. TaxID=2067992 RepID=UPI00185066E0|nr:hypothetical protein [Methylibium sp.]MBA3598740.1 hypothetical protein [Methylibium sp.]
MSTGSHHRQEVIRSALLRVAGARSDAQAVAHASVATWQRVASQLVSVIGDGGVEALYTRSLSLQRIPRPATDGTAQPLSEPAPFIAVKLSLERREAAEALEASVALLDTFITLLSNLIGEGLTDRLLNPVWADRRTDEPAQENKT